MIDITRTALDEAFFLLASHLRMAGGPRVELVICGGAALLATGIVSRTTRDVDVLALMVPGQGLADPDPLPPYLLTAAAQVEANQDLPPEWLNNRPSRGDVACSGWVCHRGLSTGFTNAGMATR